MSNYANETGNTLSLSTSLFSKIRDNILTGKYSAGEKLTENTISIEFGVSRTPVREALKQLELEGLVENIPNRGAYVLGFSLQDIQDIYGLRKAVEIVAIKWAIERISTEEIQELQEAYDLMELYTIKKDAEKMLQTNTRFHETIYKATHSRFLEQILKYYQFYIMKTRKVALTQEYYLEKVLEEHKMILEAIYEKDIKKGEMAMEVHLSNSQLRAETGYNSSSRL